LLVKPWLQFVLNSLAGMAVLTGGLLIGGQDGKMLTYTLLVLVCASLQWVFFRAWRR
jgi:4-hydroxybenzoate polyprenyltransferase